MLTELQKFKSPKVYKIETDLTSTYSDFNKDFKKFTNALNNLTILDKLEITLKNRFMYVFI